MGADPVSPPMPPQASVLPGQAAITGDDRLWGMLAHLLALPSYLLVGLSFVGPLLVYILRRSRSAFIAYHAREALNFNISLIIYFAVSLLLAKLMAQFLAVLCVAIPIFGIVMTILAGLKANRGELYRYPLTIRFVK
jgi:hypothetical protein